MIRVLTFDGTNKRHALFFDMISTALSGRGSAKQDHRVSKTERKAEAAIRVQLNAMSDIDTVLLDKINEAREKQGGDPIEEPEDSLSPDPRPRKLKAAGGELRMQQKDEFSLLERYVTETQWFESHSQAAVALEDWMDAAPKVEPPEKVEPEPAKV